MNRSERGFTLIELLIVVAIIGILAAIAIPNLLSAMHRARQKRTMADMRIIATAWEARATDTNSYNAAGVAFTGAVTWPTADLDLTAVNSWLEPTYVRRVPLYDGWSTGFKVGYTASQYTIESYGSDGTDEAETQGAVILTGKFENDIIFSGGNFVKYPEGVQSQ